MAHTGALYNDPGADDYTRRDPERTRRNTVNQFQRLGSEVTLTRPLPEHKPATTRESPRQSGPRGDWLHDIVGTGLGT
jgi:hypothetical protein